jgi:hypothetical protein
MVAIVVLGLVLSRVVGHGGARISEERAVEIARPHAGFTPEGHNIRLVRRGIPPRPFWAVSFWIKDVNGDATRATVVVLSADNGQIAEIRTSR